MNASPINTITHGDCLNILPQLATGSIDFVLTDPPYITRYKSRDGRTVANDDNDAWLKPAFAEISRVLAQDSFAVSFYGWPHADKFLAAFRAAGFRLVGHLTFPKRYTSSHRVSALPARDTPICSPKAGRRSRNTPSATSSTGRIAATSCTRRRSPCPSCCRWWTRSAAPQGVVLDPFAGSGSTLLAAKMLGRSYVGIELDAKYHAIAEQRLAPPKAA